MNVAILWLLNEKGQILLALRASHMDSDAGVWGPSVSGQVEDGESAHEAVIREAREELNLDHTLISPTFLHAVNHDHLDGQPRQFSTFYAKVPSTIIDNLTLNKDEVAAVKWVSLEEIEELVSQKSDQLIISHDARLWEIIIENLNKLNTKSLV